MNNLFKIELCSPPSFPPSSHSCHEFDSGPLPYNVLWDGLRIQEVAAAVSIATRRSAPLGRRPLLKHKEPRGLDQHKQPSVHTQHTHTKSDELTRTQTQGQTTFDLLKLFLCNLYDNNILKVLNMKTPVIY